MGLSNLLLPGIGGDRKPPADAMVQPHQNLGQRMGSYFENQYPVAGGLAQAVFGNQQAPQQEQSFMGIRPPPSMMSDEEGDYGGQGTGMAMLQSLFGRRMR